MCVTWSQLIVTTPALLSALLPLSKPQSLPLNHTVD